LSSEDERLSDRRETVVVSGLTGTETMRRRAVGRIVREMREAMVVFSERVLSGDGNIAG
jgi:hypothetical protein